MDIVKTVSRNLRNIILDRDIPVVYLSNQSGVSRRDIYNILNGEVAARVETLDSIRSALGIGWVDLLGDGWKW